MGESSTKRSRPPVYILDVFEGKFRDVELIDGGWCNSRGGVDDDMSR